MGLDRRSCGKGKKALAAVAQKDGRFSFEFTEFPWGCEYYLKTGKMMPEDGIETLSHFDAIYLGAVGYPGVPDHISLRDLLLRIRHDFDQYVNLRPVKLLKGAPCPLVGITENDIDMVFIRENSEGEYAGSGAWLYPGTPRETVIQNGVFSRFGTERIMRYAYELAKKEHRSLTSISKGNALNYSMVFWDQIFAELGKEYPEVETHSYLVDAASMFMVKDPKRYQVVVCSNLFGDILTDLGAPFQAAWALLPGQTSILKGPIHPCLSPSTEAHRILPVRERPIPWLPFGLPARCLISSATLNGVAGFLQSSKPCS